MAASFDLEVRSRNGDYSITIAEGSHESLLAAGTDVVLADRFFAPMLAGAEMPVVHIDANEANKTLGYTEQLVVACHEAGARRGSHLLALGGGVVQDLVTMLASIYMRGVPWSYAPTTLMAMADSCIGGKSSLNAGRVKNLIGNIYPPRSIAVDPSFLGTLPEADLVAGLSEAVKICFCRGSESFGTYLEHFERFSADASHAPELLHHVLSAKKWFVEIDEFDKAERRLLNFGHSFGHALESATSFAVNHGVAVAVGMLCAVKFAQERGAVAEDVRRLADHSLSLLGRVRELDQALSHVDLDAFERAFRGDKKHSADTFNLILPSRTEGVEEVSVLADGEAMGAVREALAGSLAEVGCSS